MADPSRTCIVCRSSVEPAAGVRFVLGPDGAIAVDWKAKLPGRGAWACWSRSCLEGVRERGRLDRALRATVRLPKAPWPLSQARSRTASRQRDLCGLAARAGQLKSGGNVVDRLVRKGWPSALVLAADAGETVEKGWRQKARAQDLHVERALLGSRELGAALGRTGPRSVLALGEGSLSRSFRNELKRGAGLL